MKAAVYIFSSAECMEFGFTLHSRYFKTRDEAAAYAAGFKFVRVVDF